MKNMIKEQALEKIKELEEIISKEDEKEAGRFKPKVGERYFTVCDGIVEEWYWTNDGIDRRYLESNNCFKTKEEVEMHKLRLESMAQRGPMPKEGKMFWFWNFYKNTSDSIYFNFAYLPDWWIGSVKKTEEEVEVWFDKFGKAWEK